MYPGAMCPAYAACLKAEVTGMGKKLIQHMYHGFAISLCVSLIVQFVIAQTTGHSVTPGFAARFDCEATAVLAQLGLIGVIGMTFAGAALVFEIERWSYLKQGALHFLITAAVWMPIAWLCWSPIRGRGLVFTIAGWTLTYAVNWMVQYLLARRRIRELNRSIRAFHEGGERA